MQEKGVAIGDSDGGATTAAAALGGGIGMTKWRRATLVVTAS